MEIINIQNDIQLKSVKNVDDNLWKVADFLKYPNIVSYARKVKSFFASSYLCEMAFSQLNISKTKHRNRLSHRHIKNCITVAVSPYILNVKKLSQNMQGQVSL